MANILYRQQTRECGCGLPAFAGRVWLCVCVWTKCINSEMNFRRWNIHGEQCGQTWNRVDCDFCQSERCVQTLREPYARLFVVDRKRRQNGSADFHWCTSTLPQNLKDINYRRRIHWMTDTVQQSNDSQRTRPHGMILISMRCSDVRCVCVCACEWIWFRLVMVSCIIWCNWLTFDFSIKSFGSESKRTPESIAFNCFLPISR